MKSIVAALEKARMMLVAHGENDTTFIDDAINKAHDICFKLVRIEEMLDINITTMERVLKEAERRKREATLNG